MKGEVILFHRTNVYGCPIKMLPIDLRKILGNLLWIFPGASHPSFHSRTRICLHPRSICVHLRPSAVKNPTATELRCSHISRLIFWEKRGWCMGKLRKNFSGQRKIGRQLFHYLYYGLSSCVCQGF